MKPSEFRAELKKVMPGYKWTVHKKISDSFLEATGIQSSGSNRISTLSVTKIEKEGFVEYTVKSAGCGCNADWLGECTRATLRQALRALQDYYSNRAQEYSILEHDLESGRIIKNN